jgi:hypothetical protein
LPETGNGGYLAQTTTTTERYFDVSWRDIVAATLGTAIIILAAAIVIRSIGAAREQMGCCGRDEDEDLS